MTIYSLLGEFASYIGYFFFLIFNLVIAIICAKKKTAWIWYAIGAIRNLFSLIGNQRVYSARGNGSATVVHWIIYFALLIGAAVIIIARYKKAKKCENSIYTPIEDGFLSKDH